MEVPVIPETCAVKDCPRKPQVKEVYDRPLVHAGGDTEYVCGAHTDRLGGKYRYPMVSREELPGEVIYTMNGVST